ncbi:MAG: hypothetical protein A3J74_08455 [Elusimicrobia bacterium RIFCSPHIGHO2_02_FULL_57_9]|nr:MAG: hypothetical protein A3J74_08455 [Elusimicrobia bacterium RIFCSPHIGHO2_02_FULL_57_9]
MKRSTSKKTASRGKARRDKQDSSDLNSDWQDLEVQADRLKSDWGSLAAMMGIGSKTKPV